MRQGFSLWGELKCSQWTACPWQPPALQPETAQVLFLFQLCQTQWEVDMGGGLIGIPRERVESLARGLDVPWCEYTILKFAACERVLIDQNNARLASQRTS